MYRIIFCQSNKNLKRRRHQKSENLFCLENKEMHCLMMIIGRSIAHLRLVSNTSLTIFPPDKTDSFIKGM